MDKFKFTVLLVFALAWAACQKENSVTVTDYPPVVPPDTTVISYYGNLNLGTSLLPADTIFTEVQFNFNNGSSENLGYDLNALIGFWPSFLLHWEPHSPDEKGIEEGDYIGCCALTMTDSARAQVLQWIAQGEDPNQFPQLDPMSSFKFYIGTDVNVNISDLEKNVRMELMGTDTFFIDKARVKLSGLLQDSSNVKAISGEFICYFGRSQ